MQWITVSSYEELSQIAADRIAALMKRKPNAVLGLATGSSPIGIYERLRAAFARGELDFSKACSINLDEYLGLAPDHPQSYRFFMQKHLFDHVNIPSASTFVPNGCAKDPEAECRAYDALIEERGIDLQILGIGLDGHIGFNEPGDAFLKGTHIIDLHESTIRANARFFESEAEVPRRAITMGIGGIMSAKETLLVANGSAKKEILQAALTGPITPAVPASILQLHPNLTVIYSEE